MTYSYFESQTVIQDALAENRQAYLDQEGPDRRGHQFANYMKFVSFQPDAMAEKELLEVAGPPDYLDETEAGKQLAYVYDQMGGIVYWIRVLVKDGKVLLIEQKQEHTSSFSRLTPCKKDQAKHE